MRNTLKAVARASIWWPESVSPEDDRVATLLRVYLPITYIISGAFGAYGLIYGVPAIFDAISPWYAMIWAEILIVTSALCFFANAFPARFWRIDVYGNSVLVMAYGLYSMCLIYLAFFVQGDPRSFERAALAIGSIRLVLFPLWRVFDISRDKVRNGWH